MPEQKTILVVGATGGQGGGVARHLIAGGAFKVRCLTRDPGSDRAGALEKAGAELVRGDLGDRSSLDAALTGCYGAFGVTNFWEHFGAEFEQGKNLVDAVRASAVGHFVFSTLPSSSEISDGALKVPHFDIKAQLEGYARELELPASFVHVAFYYENFLTFPPQQLEDGSFAFGSPQGDTPLAAVSVEDVGGVVTGIFGRPEQYIGQTVGAVGDDRPATVYAEVMTRTLGHKVVYNTIPREVYASLDFPGAQELADMFEFNRLYIPDRKADLVESRSLYPAIRNFDSWVVENRERFDWIPSS